MALKRSTQALRLTLLLTIIYAIPGFGAALEVEDESPNELPRGVIVMWSGSLENIPSGWVLCDGTNGTPDLRDRFVMGVGALKYMGSTGGSYAHGHRAQNHSHRIVPPGSHLSILRSPYDRRRYPGSDGGTLRTYRYYSGARAFESQSASSRIDNARHLPPYYKLAFIMKN